MHGNTDEEKQISRPANIAPWNVLVMYVMIYVMLQFVPLFTHFLLTGKLFSLVDIPRVLFEHPRFSVISALWIVLLIFAPPRGQSFGRSNIDGIDFPVRIRYLLWILAPILAAAYWLLLFMSLSWSLLEIEGGVLTGSHFVLTLFAGATAVNLFWIAFTSKFTSERKGSALDLTTFFFVTSQIVLAIFILTFGYVAGFETSMEPLKYWDGILEQGKYLHLLTLFVIFLCITCGLTSRRIVFRRRKAE